MSAHIEHELNNPAPPAKPKFLSTYAPTRFRRALTPFSRLPATAQMSESWHVAATRANTQRVIVDRPADIDPTGPTDRDYAGWATLVDQAASWLYAVGVRPWDRVAILKANHLDVVLLGCAAARIGAIPAMLAWTHTPEDLRVMLARLERPYLLTDQNQLTSCKLDADTLTTLTTRTICIDGGDRNDVIALDKLLGAPPAPVAPREAHEPMVITHTSGTTGIPKLVLHSADSIYSLALIEAERWPIVGLRSTDTAAYCDPFCHQRMTTALAAFVTITPRVLMISDPLSASTRQLLIDNKPTVVETLPNIYLAWEKLARAEVRPFRNTRLFASSFDAIHTRTIRIFLDATDRSAPIWVQSWSQTESGAVVMRPYLRRSVRRVGHRPPPTQVLGWPVASLCKLRAVNPDTGQELPRGRVGLIEMSQPGRSLGYVGEQHRHDLKRNEWWWNTGDLGVINRWGAVRMVDREVDRIPGGSAIELEDVLLDRLPDTTEVVILAVAGREPIPVLSVADDRPLDQHAWAKAISGLPPLANPIQIRWEEFPRTATWKIRRAILREQLFSGSRAIGIGRWT